MNFARHQCRWLPALCAIPVSAYAHLLCDTKECADDTTTVVYPSAPYVGGVPVGKFVVRRSARCAVIGAYVDTDSVQCSIDFFCFGVCFHCGGLPSTIGRCNSTLFYR